MKLSRRQSLRFVAGALTLSAASRTLFCKMAARIVAVAYTSALSTFVWRAIARENHGRLVVR